ncbi:rho GTPase-activating protein 15-like [Python bivittatus]|uniref:Rho GTPase-activating protein 15-like n=1 Tax=Python bivittatus TaxID=176946 RepID=A0A9F5IZF9_PYTBI|nr:rho GTPase-activating protein 15-like [Python bivittatus]
MYLVKHRDLIKVSSVFCQKEHLKNNPLGIRLASCSISPRVFPEEKLNLDDSQWEDIHVVTGALKMFFRELSEPLFPYCFFEQFVKAIKIQEHDSQVKAIKDLLQRLPRPNYDTMKILFAHLQKIAAKENMNLMSPQSLGIVFGPTLLRPEKETGCMAIHMLYQNQLIELMLSEYTKIFGSG